MKGKLMLGLSLVILSIFLINTVSAVVVTGKFSNDNPSEKIINYGESTNIETVFGSMNPPTDISVKMYDSSNSLIYSFLDSSINSYSYGKIYTITQSIYENPGTYTIKVYGKDNVGEIQTVILYLTINPVEEPEPEPNNAPEITSSPSTQINEKTSYSYQITATDADADTLTYSLMQKPTWLSISNGLITGTAPEVDYDTNYQIEISVSDGEDYDTQTYLLIVKNEEEEEDEDEDEDDEEDEDNNHYHTHGKTSSHYQTDTFYEHKYFSQFESKTIEQARRISGLSKSEQKELSWFQKLINTIIAFFKWIFRLE